MKEWGGANNDWSHIERISYCKGGLVRKWLRLV